MCDGESRPLDVKSMAPHIWSAIFRDGMTVYDWTEVKDQFNKKPWLRKYLAQINLYCLMRASERGVLLCLNKTSGALAQVVVEIDYDYAESLLDRAERINKHVAEGTLPERIPFDDQVCPRCSFYGRCLPEQQNSDPIVFLEDSTVEQLLDERAEHAERARVFKRADVRADCAGSC